MKLSTIQFVHYGGLPVTAASGFVTDSMIGFLVVGMIWVACWLQMKCHSCGNYVLSVSESPNGWPWLDGRTCERCGSDTRLTIPFYYMLKVRNS